MVKAKAGADRLNSQRNAPGLEPGRELIYVFIRSGEGGVHEEVPALDAAVPE